MKASLISWLLAGALGASLQWNLRNAAPPADDVPPLEACVTVSTSSCALTPEESARIDSSCRTDCELADELEREAETKLAELRALLIEGELDEARAAALVREISSLRERSLEAFVGAVVGVREVLDRERVARLLEECCVQACATSSRDCAIAPKR